MNISVVISPPGGTTTNSLSPASTRSVMRTSASISSDVPIVSSYSMPNRSRQKSATRIDAGRPPRFHYDLARRLLPLRAEGVMIVGSGNIVHNLRRIDWDDQRAPTEAWAGSFDATAKDLIRKGLHEDLIQYEQLEHASAAVPTNDHYLPLLYALGAQQPGETVEFLYEGFQYANISMRSLSIG